jgi:hypothetical protein
MDFEDTWVVPYEAFVSWDEVGAVASAVNKRFASNYTIVDRT